MERKVIASYCLCNTASINIYEIDTVEDRVLAGFNDEEPEWFLIETIVDGQDSIQGFTPNFTDFIPFNECMRV